MGIVWTLLAGMIGGVLGMLAVFRSFPSAPAQWIGALVIGVLGGWLGGALLSVLGLEKANWVGSLVVAFAGAVLILMGISKMTGTPAKR
jgi:uncharacterized membrane protein YeaQ/YmgE (transglycosylase-associated protein family)